MSQSVQNLIVVANVLILAVWALFVASKGNWQGRPVARGTKNALWAFGFAALCFGIFLILVTTGFVALP